MSDPSTPPSSTAPKTPINAKNVFAGIGLGIVLSWGLRVPLWAAFAGTRAGPGFYVAVLLPTAALIAAIVWAARTRRPGWAVGMSIYFGLGVLVFGPLFALYAICAPAK